MKEKTRKKEQRKGKNKEMEDIQAKGTREAEDAFDDTSDANDDSDGSYCDSYKIRNWASDDSDEDHGDVIEWQTRPALLLETRNSPRLSGTVGQSHIWKPDQAGFYII